MRFPIFATSAAAIMTVSAASAGGFSAPEVQGEPVVAVVPAPVAAGWEGGYAGATLGYAFGGDDRIGEHVGGVLQNTLGNAELSGPNVSLRGGYRWQRDNWVVGPELSYTIGSISDEFDYGADGTFESEVNSTAAIKLKAGYLVRPDMLVFGTAGWTTGDFTYVNNGNDVDYDADGYVVGLGVERMLTDRMSVTGEYEYSNFGKTDVEISPGVISKATPEFSNVKIGVNFKF